MNRLTTPNGHYCDDCGYKPSEFCACNIEIAMYERLKQYEDAEEQGRLVEVRHGRWKLHDNGDGTCSRCGSLQKHIWDMDGWQNFCGHCGADMRDGGQDE